MTAPMKKNGVFITGIDTDVGKTVITAGLLRSFLCLEADRTKRTAASAATESHTLPQAVAFKPIQTGCTRNADGTLSAPDADFYSKVVADLPAAHPVVAPVLFPFAIPCSPHLAAAREGTRIDPAKIIQAVEKLQQAGLFPLIEGAGGLYVPINEQSSMLDLMADLGLPVILVAANRLGVINHVLLSLNALQSRGVAVAGIIMNHPAHIEMSMEDSEHNDLILRDNIATIRKLSQVPVFEEIPHLHHINSLEEDGSEKQKTNWRQLAQLLSCVAETLASNHFSPSRQESPWDNTEAHVPDSPNHLQISPPSSTSSMGNIHGLNNCAPKRLENSSEALIYFDKKHIWHPYTSALSPLPAREATRTKGCRIYLRDGSTLIDGMASWWCAIHGYGHPRLVAAMQRQSAEMSHIMFGGLTHKPAVDLARKLLPLLPEGLEHIFFADSGSVAVEVAMKMALQYWQATESQTEKQFFLTPRGGYHGDTIGAMSVCDPVNGMHTLFSGILPRQIFVERPTCRFDQDFDPHSTKELETVLNARHHEIAALILEPIVQGAGGMWFYHPEYLHRARELCDHYGVLLILDEIATGFGRTGKLFASEWSGISPDIICLGKALTGGCLTLSATVASRRIAHGISANGGVFMHGPTFMGNPLACAVANESLDILLQSDWRNNIASLEKHLTNGLAPCRDLPGVADVRILGGIGVVEVQSPVDMVKIQDFFVENGVWIRPFGRLIYLMPPYIATEQDIESLTGAIVAAIKKFY